MKRLHRHRFNLIEILIALGILAIGMVAVLGLFPVGFATTRDAMAESSSADAADQMLHMLQFKLKQKNTVGVYQNWIDMVGTSTTSGTGIPTVPATQSDVVIPAWSLATPAAANWAQIEPFTAGCVIKDASTVGLYKIIRFVHTKASDVIPAAGNSDAKDEPFYSASDDILDFEAIAKVWKEKFNVDPASGAAGELTWDKAVVLNVEISWPANQPDVSKRKKALYRLELFNGN
jgi:Tfp pilus assembly protein PilV